MRPAVLFSLAAFVFASNVSASSSSDNAELLAARNFRAAAPAEYANAPVSDSSAASTSGSGSSSRAKIFGDFPSDPASRFPPEKQAFRSVMMGSASSPESAAVKAAEKGSPFEQEIGKLGINAPPVNVLESLTEKKDRKTDPVAGWEDAFGGSSAPEASTHSRPSIFSTEDTKAAAAENSKPIGGFWSEHQPALGSAPASGSINPPPSLEAVGSLQSNTASSVSDALKLKAADPSQYGTARQQGFEPSVDGMGRSVERYASFSNSLNTNAKAASMSGFGQMLAGNDADWDAGKFANKDAVSDAQDKTKDTDAFTRALIVLGLPMNLEPYKKNTGATANKAALQGGVEALANKDTAPDSSSSSNNNSSNNNNSNGGIGPGGYVTVGLISGFAIFGGVVGGYIWYKRAKNQKVIEIHHATDDVVPQHNPMVSIPTHNAPVPAPVASSSAPSGSAAPVAAPPVSHVPHGIIVKASSKGV
ncbi:hypothetical protein HDU97_006295 [Phlyctochytrium planicorne]|nr:hypothetical protein HDU97_006295 [Phlyctochytrium planicorne]